MAVDRAYYSIPIATDEWPLIEDSIYDGRMDTQDNWHQANIFQSKLNKILGEPFPLKEGQLFEFRPDDVETNESTKPLALVYINRVRGNLYPHFSKRYATKDPNKAKLSHNQRLFITLPNKLLEKMTFEEAAKVYDLPEDIGE